MRSLGLCALVVGVGACGGVAPDVAPVITSLSYMPMQITVNVKTAIDGSLAFHDENGDVRHIVLGFVDPKGTLSEAMPAATDGTLGQHDGTVAFRANVTGTVVGTHQLSVRLIDDAALSSEPIFEPVEVVR